ncbi:hypothetical protein H5P28_01125 [Ruficoccus amylovorans]|uniref:TrbL/VirB6 plasmid conjugal transfer protein n=1 Tax=Ruficoccus amylovorans TaxID=1804625 RepID=A0A842HBP7_9BACT|nr:hypothetical protein [Ruficoccus amylovorans]MBC2592851.1 hypothetical protein [Ruficoccus amylovorans]
MNLIGPITMENFESSILELQGTLLFVAYFILVAGLIVRIMRISDTGGDMVAMTKAVFIGFFLVALMATGRYWFNAIDQGMYDAADVINTDFGSEPYAVTDALIKTIDEDPEAEGWGVERIVNSVYLSIVYGISKLGITVAALFQVPFYILQYVLKWLGFLFLPIGLALFMFPSLANIGVKLIANMLAVMAWPIGFAITNLAAMGLVEDFADASTFSGNDTGAALYMMSFGSLIMGLIAALILVIGTLATPTIMFMIFASGTGLQALAGSALRTAAVATSRGSSSPGVTLSPSAVKPTQATPVSAPQSDPGLRPPVSSSVPVPSGAPQAAVPAMDNPLLPVNPHDPSGSQLAAKLYAQASPPKPHTQI